MFSSFWVSIPFGETKINHIDYILLFTVTNKEIVGFHISVNKVVIMNELKPLYHLISDHYCCFNGEFPFAVVEKIFQTWSKKVHNHGVVITFNTKPVNRRDTCATIKNFVDLSLIEKLWELSLYGFL